MAVRISLTMVDDLARSAVLGRAIVYYYTVTEMTNEPLKPEELDALATITPLDVIAAKVNASEKLTEFLSAPPIRQALTPRLMRERK